MTNKQINELNALFDKDKTELTVNEKKHKKYLLNIWIKEQEEKEYTSWKDNQPI